MTQDVDDRSPTAKALSKVSEVSTISLMMVVPVFIGHFVDKRFGTVILFTALGLILGVFGAVLQLIKLVSPPKVPGDSESDLNNGDDSSSSKS